MTRRGIALPMVVLVLAALGLLSALALADALQAWRGAELAADEVRARAASAEALELLFVPEDLPWLCLQPPAAAVERRLRLAQGDSALLRWWSLPGHEIRGEVVARARRGGRHGRLAWLRPDSVPASPELPGCPDAGNLRPRGTTWIQAHPDGS